MRRVSWQRLSTQVVIMQVAILVVTMAAGFAVVQWNLKRQLYQQYENRSLVLAQTLASQPSIVNAVVHGQPGGEAQRLALAAAGTGSSRRALFVVITDDRGVRYSHPNPKLIGKPVQADREPVYTEPFRTGRDWMGIQTGTLGPVAAGKAPLWYRGKLSGQVSVGISLKTVSQSVTATLPSLAAYLLGVLGIGVLAALALA